MPTERKGLRKREILLALALGGVAAGGAALMLSEMNDDHYVASVEFSGPSEMTYPVMPFDQIATEGPQDVVVTYGEELTVRSEGSPEALAQLEAVVENGQLLIRPKKGFDFDWGSVEDATFYVTMPRLDRIALAGSGDIQIDRIEGENFEGVIGGPGELRIAGMKVDRVDFTINGSGDLIAAGTAGDAHVSIGGSGTVDAAGLSSSTASISIFGTGDVELTVQDKAQVSITGAGDVDISGPGRCSVTRMGGGDVRCAGGGGDQPD